MKLNSKTNQTTLQTSFGVQSQDLLFWIAGEIKRRNQSDSRFGKEAFECYRLFNGSLTEAQAAKTAYDLLIKECGSIEWAIAHFKLQEMDND